MAKGYYKAVKRMSTKTTPRQDRAAKSLAGLVKTFVKTKK